MYKKHSHASITSNQGNCNINHTPLFPQNATPEDTAPVLNQKQTKFFQEVTRTFLYFAQLMDGTMLTTYSALATAQAKPIITILQQAKQFLDYMTSNSDTKLTYHARKMVLATHSDVSY